MQIARHDAADGQMQTLDALQRLEGEKQAGGQGEGEGGDDALHQNAPHHFSRVAIDHVGGDIACHLADGQILGS